MKMKQLEYLLKIAECGSITKASEQLFVSQPTLTKAVMNLEEEYGVQLLVRKTRGCFRDPKIRCLPVVDETGAPDGLVNELIWIKRAGEPLNLGERQFLTHLYHHFGRETELEQLE